MITAEQVRAIAMEQAEQVIDLQSAQNVVKYLSCTPKVAAMTATVHICSILGTSWGGRRLQYFLDALESKLAGG